MNQSKERIESNVEQKGTQRIALSKSSVLNDRRSGEVAIDINSYMGREEERVNTANQLCRDTETRHDG